MRYAEDYLDKAPFGRSGMKWVR